MVIQNYKQHCAYDVDATQVFHYPFKAGDTVFLALYGGSGNISVAKITRIRSQTDKDSFLTSGFFVVEDNGIETFIAPRLIGQLVFSTHAEALAEHGQRQGNCI